MSFLKFVILSPPEADEESLAVFANDVVVKTLGDSSLRCASFRMTYGKEFNNSTI
ncbi:MAG TPA: hypothetical protein VFO76_01770 [Candidatus Kapabacteria bacterium]|nr:hypothetical protein [Candidatus Kapabacteria bacterium]